MGRSGDFVVKYDVKIQELERALGRATKALRAHRNEINQAQLTGPQLTSAQRSQMDAVTQSTKANNDAQKLLLGTERRRSTILGRLGVQNQSAIRDFGQIESSLRRLAAFWSSAALIFGAQRLAQSVAQLAGSYQFVVRELTVIGEEGEAVYRRLATAGFGAAAATGRAFTEAADAMRAWVRQGFSAVEIADLTRTTLIGLNLTELTSIQLVRTLTAQMKAFNIPANESITIIDKLLGVSRKFAIETTQLATGMRRFAAVSNEAGISLDQQAGLMTAMMVRTQQAAQMVGRAGRTILVRLRRNAVEAVEEIAKVNVFTDESRQTYRNLFDVLEDVAGVWGTLTDAARANIAFQAAGLRQQEFFIALMEDFNLAQEAQIVSLSSAGLAYKANRQLVDTFQKSLAALRTEWERLLSLQSGVLEFFQNIVNGLRTFLNHVQVLPAGIIRIGVALTALGGIVLGITFSPIVGGMIALAGAAALLVEAIGSKATPALGDLAQLARETAQARLTEARNTEELARLYIKYFDILEDGEKKESLLRQTRKGLIEINPTLVSAGQTLEETYKTLTTGINAMSAATDIAERSFRGLSEAMLERSIVESKQAISELIPDFQKIGSGVDANDIEQVRKLGKTLRQDVGDEWTRIIDIQNVFARTGDIAFDRLINRTGVYGASLSKLEEAEVRLRAARDADIAARRDDGSVDTRIGLKLPAAMREYIAVATKANLITNEQSLTAERLTQALDNLAKAQEELNKFLIPSTVVGAGDVVTTIDDELVKEKTKQLESQFGIQKLILEIVANEAVLRAGGAKDAEFEAQLAQRVFDTRKASLRTIIATTKDAEKRKAAEALLGQLEANRPEALRLILQLLKAEMVVLQQQQKIKEKDARDDAKRVAAVIALDLRLRNARKVSADRMHEVMLQAEADRIRRVQGEVAASDSILQSRLKDVRREKEALDRLRESGLGERDPKVITQQAQLDEARQAALNELIANRRVRIQANADINALNVRLLEQEVDAQLALLETEEARVPFLEAEVRKRRESVAEANALGAGLDNEKKQKEALLALGEAEQALTVSKGKIEKANSEARKSAADAQFDIDLRRIRLMEGEEAGLEAVVVEEQRKLDILKESTAARVSEAEIIAQQEVVNTSIADLEDFRARRRIDSEQTLKELESERRAAELQHNITMAELEGGRQAGLDVELRAAEERLEAAKEIIDIVQREIALKQARNDIDDINDAKRVDARGRELQFQEELIRFAGQQLTAAISGDLGASGFISGVSGLISSSIEGPLGIAVAAGGAVLGALFEGPAEDLEDSLDRNTTAIDRNTQTLQDVFAQQIGVPTGFVLPSSIAMQGALPGGGGSIQQINQITIQVDGRGQDVDQIAVAVQSKLDKQFSINSRRGFGTNVLSLG